MKILIFLSLFCSYTALASPQIQFEEDYSLPIVYINIVSDVGSAHDPQNHDGLAFLASQMLTRGTEKLSKADFSEKIEQLGGSFSVGTQLEGTVIQLAVLAENLEPFLALVSQALIEPKFSEAELKKLKKETEGDILELKGNDSSLVNWHFNRFFFGDHPYSSTSIGTQKSILNISMAQIKDHYASHFGEKTLALFGSGAVEKNKIQNWFSDLTKSLSKIHPNAKPVHAIAEPNIPHKMRALLIDKPNTTQTQVLLGGKGISPLSKNFYTIQLANYSFGGSSFEARLMKELRVKRGWTYGAANRFHFAQKPRYYAMYFFPKTADSVPAIKLTLNLFQDFVTNGITEKEFDFAKQSLVNNAPFNFDTSKKRLSNVTSEYLMHLPKKFYHDFAEHIADVNYADIKSSLQNFFNPNELTLVIVGDASKLKDDLKKVPGFENLVIKNYLED